MGLFYTDSSSASYYVGSDINSQRASSVDHRMNVTPIFIPRRFLLYYYTCCCGNESCPYLSAVIKY